jgi:hypothetical protein
MEEMKGNQLRRCFSALTYTLVATLWRLGLHDTNNREVLVDNIGSRLPEIGAAV